METTNETRCKSPGVVVSCIKTPKLQTALNDTQKAYCGRCQMTHEKLKMRKMTRKMTLQAVWYSYPMP